MNGGYYVLDGHTPTRCDDMQSWARWFENADRQVARDEINGVTISTVFLGIDHSFGHGSPVLFETMVFGGLMNDLQVRYCTWEAAEARHKAIVEEVKKSEDWPEEA